MICEVLLVAGEREKVNACFTLDSLFFRVLSAAAPSLNNDSDKSFLVTFGLYGGAGFTLAASVVAGLLGGNWLDKKLGSAPWLLLVGLIGGAVGGFYNFMRILKMAGKDNQ